MKLQELKVQCLRSKELGLGRVMLVITRKSPPCSDFIRVKGLGKGYVMNCKETAAKWWEICAQFEADTILKTIAKQESQHAFQRSEEK